MKSLNRINKISIKKSDTIIILIYTFFLMMILTGIHFNSIILTQLFNGTNNEYIYPSLIQNSNDDPPYSEEWDQMWGTSSDDYGRAVAVDDDNNIYLAGYTGSFAVGNMDALIVKFDLMGNLIWNRTWGGYFEDQCMSVATYGNNTIYITGFTNSFGSISDDIFLVKYDSLGNQIWNQTWGGSASDITFDVAVDVNDNIYLTGRTDSFGLPEEDVFLVKYNSSGNKLWNRSWGGSFLDFGYGVAVDGNNNIYSTGFTMSFGTVGVPNAFLVKYDSAGYKIWNLTWGGSANDFAYDVVVDSNNSIYITGYTWSFGTAGNPNAFLVKYDSLGNQIWNRTWDNSDFDGGESVTVDYNNNIYITGFTGTLTFLVKYDSLGNEIWNKTWSRFISAKGYDVAIDSNNSAYITGKTLKFTQGDYDAFIVKFGIDSDNDGLTDFVEINIYGTNPNNADTDYDLIPDAWEIDNLLDPLNSSDSSLDPDLDGLTNLDEYNNSTDPNDQDTDNDLMPDGWEVDNNLDPLIDDSLGDGDGDTLTNLLEYQFSTDPGDNDTDDDGLNDYAEIYVHETDPLNPDTDGDGLSDGSEINTHSTNPNESDTDGDGLSDGEEVAEGTNPLDKSDNPMMKLISSVVTWTSVSISAIAGILTIVAFKKKWEKKIKVPTIIITIAGIAIAVIIAILL